jgi:glycosyltransferase involved in cell wall biosynthesis
MKIVFLDLSSGIYRYARGDSLAIGGAERQQWLLARALAASGSSVTVELQGVLQPGSRTTIEDVQFVSFPGNQTSSTPYQRLLSLHCFLRTELPDWLYWRCASHLWGPVVTIAKLAGVRTIFAAGFDTDVQPRHALVERPRWWPLYAWGLSNTDRIFVQHSGQLSGLPSRWRLKATIIRNMINITSTTKPHQDREKYIAWVAMLRQPKRPDLLLEIARKASNLRFVVCGGLSDHRSPQGYGASVMAALKNLPNVDYHGQVAPAKAREIIADASVLLCTSEGEGFPNTFLEAWASGTPVVSLKIDPDERIERQGLGAISRDVDKAVMDLKMLLDSSQRREEISARARHYVVENHSEDVVTSSFHRAIENAEQFALA